MIPCTVEGQQRYYKSPCPKCGRPTNQAGSGQVNCPACKYQGHPLVFTPRPGCASIAAGVNDARDEADRLGH